MAEKIAGPPVLDKLKFFVHSEFLKQRRALTARIKFFSGDVVHDILLADYIMLPETSTVAGLDAARVREVDWLEDLLRKQLGFKQYSTCLDLPGISSPSEEEHDRGPTQPRQSKRARNMVISSSDDEAKEVGVIERAKDDQPASHQENDEYNATPSSSRKRKRTVESEQTEASELAVTIPPPNPPIPPLAPVLIATTSHQGMHITTACWRRKPKVLVLDSDPSQNTSSGAATQSSAFSGKVASESPTKTRTARFPLKKVEERQEGPSRAQNQPSSSTSQGQSQSQHRGSQVSSASGSGTSHKSPWRPPELEESDGEYNPGNRSFDEGDDDGWSENSFSDEAEDELEPFPTQGFSQLLTTMKRRRSSVRGGDGMRSLVDLHFTAYCERAALEYGTQSQTQLTQGDFGTQVTRQSQNASQSLSKPRSWQHEQRHQLVNAVLSLLAHWTQRPLHTLRRLWKSLPVEKRNFEELQKQCLTRDLSATRKEYNATGLFTQHTGEEGPARKKRKRIVQPLRRVASDNTEVGEEEEEDGSSSEVFFGGQPLEAPAQSYGLYNPPFDAGDDDDDDDDEAPPPIQFRQTHLWSGGSKTLKSRFPYPTEPNRGWAKRICRVLAALYGVSRASKVYVIWEKLGGDASEVERVLSETREVREFGLGEVPRPWA